MGVDRAMGFRPIRARGSELQTNIYEITASSTALLLRGDPVSGAAAGTVALATSGDALKVIGVVESLFDSDKKPITGRSASTAGFATVIDDPNAMFVIQSDSGTTSVSSADVFATADFTYTAGSTAIGQSKVELDASDIGTGTQLRILGKYAEEGNDWGEHVDLIVQFAEHLYKTSTTTL